jgi:secondary thiamine-phosphate synthase enzyme
VRQVQHQIETQTRAKGLYPVTAEIAAWVASAGIADGLLTVFLQHTSASLVIQENYDPDVTRDLADFFERVAPENDPRYRHTLEGPDDMPAHIRTALSSTQLSIPVVRCRMALGTWQGIYVFEHRAAAQRRTLALHLIGEP